MSNHQKMRALTITMAASLTVLLTGTVHAAVGDQIAKIVAADGAASDKFGTRVAIDGGLAIVAAPYHGDNGDDSGSVYLIDTANGQQTEFLASDGALGHLFGFSVDISGTTAIACSYPFSAAYLINTTNGQQFKITPGSYVASVAIDGNVAIVGTPSDNVNGSNSGSAYLYDATTGQQLFKLLPLDGAIDASFGFSVAISGDIAIIGSPTKNEAGFYSGAVYLFDVATGLQLAKLVPSDGAAMDSFGSAVAISGNTAIIGASQDDDNGTDSGSVYIFDVNTGQELFKILPGDGAAGDLFGTSVGIDAFIVAIGASSDDDNGSGSGSAYLFNAATGQEIMKFLPLDGAAGDAFGQSIAISDGLTIVGASSDDDLGSASGSAYVFDSNVVIAPQIVQQPLPFIVANTGDGPQSFSVIADGGQPLSYQWRFEGVPLSNDASHNGVTTDMLMVLPTIANFGLYDVVVTNSEGSATSDASILAVKNTLPEDLNDDGVVDTADLGLLLSKFGFVAP